MQAAQILNVSLHSLRKNSRIYHIRRWPFRKIQISAKRGMKLSEEDILSYCQAEHAMDIEGLELAGVCRVCRKEDLMRDFMLCVLLACFPIFTLSCARACAHAHEHITHQQWPKGSVRSKGSVRPYLLWKLPHHQLVTHDGGTETNPRRERRVVRGRRRTGGKRGSVERQRS